MKLFEKFKYVLIGSVTTCVMLSSISFSNDVFETIQAKFFSMNLSGNSKTVNTTILEYNDTLFVPLFDVVEATGIKIGMDDNSNIKLSNYDLISKAPLGLNSYQSGDSIYLNWHNNEADYYVVSYKAVGDDEYSFVTDNSGNPKKLAWYPDYSLKFTGAMENETIEFVVTAVNGGISSNYSEPIKVKFTGSNTVPKLNTKSVELSTFEIITEKYSSDKIVMMIVSNDRISKSADKSILNQSKWLRTFETTLANKSANTNGRSSTYSVTEALNAANNSVK